MTSFENYQNLIGKKILVTGGSRGIGAAIVKNLAARGAQIAFTYSSNEEAAKKVQSELPGSGHLILQMNSSDEASVQKACEKAFEALGGLDGLVNNAGITKDQLLLRLKTEDFKAVIDTNLMGTFWATRACLKLMLKSRKGSIVHISSVVGTMGNPGQANYAASKAAIEAFGKSVALEVASRGIRVNSIAPGFIATEMTGALTEQQKQQMLVNIPMQRIGEADEVASAVAFLVSDESKYITGHTLHINGGMLMV